MEIKLPVALENMISETYNQVPYHNWEHWKVVWETMRILENDYTCLSPWEMAWYFHDAGHTWIANSPIDEEKSAEIAENILLEYWWFPGWYIQDVKNMIVWTVFSERWNIVDLEQKLLADADISHLWKDFNTFLNGAIAHLLETTNHREDLTDERIIEYFTKDQIWFFNYLTGITWDKNNPFLTEQAKFFLPGFSGNRDELLETIEKNPELLISLTRDFEEKCYN